MISRKRAQELRKLIEQAVESLIYLLLIAIILLRVAELRQSLMVSYLLRKIKSKRLLVTSLPKLVLAHNGKGQVQKVALLRLPQIATQ